MARILLLAASALCLAACTAAGPPRAAAAAPPEPAPAEEESNAGEPIFPGAVPRIRLTAPAAAALTDADVHGRWQILSVDGRLPIGAGERAPYLVFGPGSYGGSTGCNSFGGYGVLVDGRYYASGAMQTAIGCQGALEAQERAILSILAASPVPAPGADGTLSLASAPGTIVVRRDGAAAAVPAVRPARPEWDGETLLAGTEWTIGSVDGAWQMPREGRRALRFEADRWHLSGGCGPTGGTWRQAGDRIEARGPQFVSRACAAGAAALDDAIVAMLESRPRFVTGPNGEILIGGGGHWLTGERPRAVLADEAGLLAGAWRIMAIDGRPPEGEREAGIAVGPTGYSGSAGCNGFQGYQLAHRRRLFVTMPISTEMACGGGLGAQERRVTALLAAAPRIALGGDGEIALVDEAGSLRLRRIDGAAAWAPEGRLWTGAPLAAELTTLGAEPLRMRISEPETRLRLSAQRFDVETGCGRLGGIWRRQSAVPAGVAALEFLTDAEPDPAGACAGALAARLGEFKRLFNGPARVLIGPSGELLIAGDRHWLGGRVLPQRRRR